MCPVKYYTIMRQSKDADGLDMRWSDMPGIRGLNRRLRAFNTTPKTVRKWFKTALGCIR